MDARDGDVLRMQIDLLVRLPSLLAVLAAAPTAYADKDEDGLLLSAKYSLISDSNLFRLPGNADTTALIGRTSAAEQIGVTSLGFRARKNYSLQRLELDLNLVDYSYSNFGYLNFTSGSYGAAWRWSLTPYLRGNLTFDRKEVPNSFTDYQGFRLRNHSTDTNSRLDLTYGLGGPWQMLLGVARSDQVNLVPIVAEGDTSTGAADVGLQYVFASGNSVAYVLKNATGRFVNRPLQPELLLDDSYRQLDNEVRLRWGITGKSTVEANATYVVRSHPNFAQRDYRGLNTGATLNWNLTGKSSLQVRWLSELASYQTDAANYGQNDRLLVAPMWQLSPKMTLRGSYELGARKYLGSPTGQTVSQRSDTTRDIALSFDWQPYERIKLGAALQSSRRDSNLTGFDFVVNQTTFSAQLSY